MGKEKPSPEGADDSMWKVKSGKEVEPSKIDARITVEVPLPEFKFAIKQNEGDVKKVIDAQFKETLDKLADEESRKDEE